MTSVLLLLATPAALSAACTGAPMMMVDHDFHENLTPAKLDAILDALK